jgi:hypothetical protein
VAAVLLILSFEPLSEKIGSINYGVTPLLKQLPPQQVGYVERMLSSADTQARRTRTVVQAVGAWLVVNAALLWWATKGQGVAH